MNDLIQIPKMERMPYFDFLEMFAMFMVLWGHAIQHLQTGEVRNEPVHKFYIFIPSAYLYDHCQIL